MPEKIIKKASVVKTSEAVCPYCKLDTEVDSDIKKGDNAKCEYCSKEFEIDDIE